MTRRRELRKGRTPGRRLVVCAGDSITHGLASANYVNRLAGDPALGDCDFVNAGWSGDLAWNLLQRLDPVVACRPDVVTVLIGTNDVAAHISDTWLQSYLKRQRLPERPTITWYRDALAAVVTRLRTETAARLALLEIPILGEDLESVHNRRVREYNAVIHDVARTAGIVVLPLHGEMVSRLPGTSPAAFDDTKGPMVRAAAQRFLLRRRWDDISRRAGFDAAHGPRPPQRPRSRSGHRAHPGVPPRHPPHRRTPRMTTEPPPQPLPPTSSAKPPNPVGLMVVVLGVIALGAGAGALAGLGAASILAGLTALVLAFVSFGGSLRADLVMVARFAPVMVLATTVPRLLTPHHPWIAIAVAVFFVFVAGLLPALGPRHRGFGMGLGLGTTLSYAMVLQGSVEGWQVVLAAVVAVAVIVVVRLIAGIADPSGPVRSQAAAVLTADDPAVAATYAAWLRDRPVRWLGEVITAGLAYRIARSSVWTAHPARQPMPADEKHALDEAAAHIAALVRQKSPTEPPTPIDTESESVAWAALRSVQEAAVTRDTTRVDVERKVIAEFERATLATPLSWQSETLRHALRSAVGMLGVLALAHATVGSNDPLLPTLLTTAFSVLQVSWSSSFAKARQRLVGVAGGAALTFLALKVLPSQALLATAVVALVVAFWFLTSRPVVANGAFVMMSVGLNAGTRGLDPVHTLVEYALLVLAAVAIAVFFGFAAIPAIRPTSARRRNEASFWLRTLTCCAYSHGALKSMHRSRRSRRSGQRV